MFSLKKKNAFLIQTSHAYILSHSAIKFYQRIVSLKNNKVFK